MVDNFNFLYTFKIIKFLNYYLIILYKFIEYKNIDF